MGPTWSNVLACSTSCTPADTCIHTTPHAGTNAKTLRSLVRRDWLGAVLDTLAVVTIGWAEMVHDTRSDMAQRGVHARLRLLARRTLRERMRKGPCSGRRGRSQRTPQQERCSRSGVHQLDLLPRAVIDAHADHLMRGFLHRIGKVTEGVLVVGISFGPSKHLSPMLLNSVRVSRCVLQRPRSGESDGQGGDANMARFKWSHESHHQFVNAVNTLGVDSAPPIDHVRRLSSATWTVVTVPCRVDTRDMCAQFAVACKHMSDSIPPSRH